MLGSQALFSLVWRALKLALAWASTRLTGGWTCEIYQGEDARNFEFSDD